MPSKELKNKMQKDESKYTLKRNKEDIKNLKKLRNVLKNDPYEHDYNSFITDSEIYRKLPVLYLKAIKKNADLEMIISELKAENSELMDLKNCFCRIMEITNEKEEDVSNE